MKGHVKSELSGGVLTLTLQRPDKKNALTCAMYNALSDALEKAETDPSVRVVLSGAMATALPPAKILPISPPSRAAKVPSTARPITSSRPR